MNNELTELDTLNRRTFMAWVTAGATAVSLVPFDASATPQAVDARVKEVLGGASVQDGKINVILPEIAEDGGTVPLSVEVDSPMTDADHVKELHLFADGNPLPDLAMYKLGPQNGRARISVRIRLGKTQNVVAVAKMSNGENYIARRKIKVTLGGCGG